MTFVWTEDLVATIRKLAGEKASAGEIACELGAQGYVVTRNAVIGKCRRSKIELQSGLTGWRATAGASKAAQKRSQRKRRARYAPVTDGLSAALVPQKALAARFVETKSDNLVPLGELNSDDCHWPMGGFADLPPYLYCGDPVVEGCAYCARHLRLSIRDKETNHVTQAQRDHIRSSKDLWLRGRAHCR
jgi:GcrA cell cycle regulator